MNYIYVKLVVFRLSKFLIFLFKRDMNMIQHDSFPLIRFILYILKFKIIII